MLNLNAAGLAMLTAGCIWSNAAHAINFTKLIEDTDPGVTFVSGFVSLNNNTVASFSFGDNGFSTAGIKGVGGTPTALASNAGFFNALGSDLNDNGLGVFTGFSFGGAGVFTGSGGPTTAIATAGGIFGSGFGTPVINDAGTVAFHAIRMADGNDAIVSSIGGSITEVFETSPQYTAVGIGSDIANDGTLVFWAGFGSEPDAIFTANADGTGLAKIVESINGQSLPSNRRPSINNNGDVLFVGAHNNQRALFVYDGNNTTLLLDTSGPFSDINPTAWIDLNDHGDYAFLADLDAGGTGLFVGPDPVADKVIAVGDTLFGSTVTVLDFDRGLNNEGDLAFLYTLADGRKGVALATNIPEPTSLMLLSVGAFGLLGQPRRSSRSINPSA